MADAAGAAAGAGAGAAEGDDPFLWLEDIDGDRAMAWVRARNARYLPELEGVPGFDGWRQRAQAVLEDKRRIAWPSGLGPHALTADRVYNFWRDDEHVRGILRESPRQRYEAGAPLWETLLDMDALAAAEGRNLQFGGATALPSDSGRADRVLVRLSVGGRDAVELREFDAAARRFVPPEEGGFFLAEAKQDAVFLDRDRLLVASALGPVTRSGYAREARLWRRGTPFSAAPLLLRTGEESVAVEPFVFGEGDALRAGLIEATSFWTARIHHLAPDGTLWRSPLPDDADFRLIADLGDGPRAFAILRSPWRGAAEGSIVSSLVPAAPAAAASETGVADVVFAPDAHQAVEGIMATGRALHVHLLQDVAARLLRIDRDEDGWRARPVALPDNRALTLIDSDRCASIYASIDGFAEPSRLVAIGEDGAMQEIAAAPAFFDGAAIDVARRFATSKDGTKVPFFVIRPKGAPGGAAGVTAGDTPDGKGRPLPTCLWSYGGFEIPLTPSYLGPDMMQWLAAGGQYVVANIRGGGEYGPRWHKAALLEKRQNSYDDLHAVATELKASGLASKIAVHGRSNGGLMAAVAYTERPDLYDAALVGVPLADMKRYHLLLAGASWMAEYGNPDTADWDFIRRYSPYQNLRAGARYPRVFFYTSTKDDRVHPGHARKMVARMEAMGHPIYYYENVDGGHAGVANLKEAAYRYALMLAYLQRELL